MHEEELKISLTYELGGEHLAKGGSYTTAQVVVKPRKGMPDEVKVVKPLETLEEPDVRKATMNVVLGDEFCRQLLAPPRKPSRMSIEAFLKTRKGKLYAQWNQLSFNKKIFLGLKDYVRDMGGEKFTFEIL